MKCFNILGTLLAKLRLGKIAIHIPRNATLLDFGCSYQAFLLNAF